MLLVFLINGTSMHYLLLSIMTSTLFGLGLKVSEIQNRDRIVVAFFNYLAGTILAAAYWLSPVAEAQAAISWSTFWVGALAGTTWVAGLLTMMVSIRETGITLTAAMSRLSVVLPIIACVIVWNEHVGLVDGAGIALAVAAVLLLSTRAAKRGGKVTSWGVLLLALLLLSLGLAQLSLKIFERYCPPDEVTPFVMSLFLVATMLTGIWMLAGKSKVLRRDISFGAILGIPNLLTGAFLTLALQEMNGAVVFPVSNVGSLFLMALFGVWVWKERLGQRGAVGLALTVIAIILINMG